MKHTCALDWLAVGPSRCWWWSLSDWFLKIPDIFHFATLRYLSVIVRWISPRAFCFFVSGFSRFHQPLTYRGVVSLNGGNIQIYLQIYMYQNKQIPTPLAGMFFRGISTLPRSSWEILPGQLSSQIRSKKCKYLRKNITLTWINHDVFFTSSCMQGLFYELPQTSSIFDLVEDGNSLKKTPSW